MLNEQLKIQIIQLLLSHQPDMIGIFGSFARNENDEDSDLDILVKFRDKISLLELVKLEQNLSDKLGIKVDLITENGLKNQRLRNFIFQDLKIIYSEKEQPNLS